MTLVGRCFSFFEFWKRFRENLKNATPIWLIILAVSMFLFIDFRIINSGAAGLPAWMLIPLYAGAFDTAAIYVYIIPLTARFVYSTGAAFKCRHTGSGLFSQDPADGCGHCRDSLSALQCNQTSASLLYFGSIPSGLLLRAYVYADLQKNDRQYRRRGQALGTG